MIVFSRLCILVALFLLAATCAPPPADDTGGVKGVVQCTGGGPVENALVSLDPGVHTATTGTDGAFLITSVPSGTYSASVEWERAPVLSVENFAVPAQTTVDLGTLSLSCSQPCSSNDACSAGSYCAKTAGDCPGQGTCTRIPDACTAVFDPVCGCDGNTYSNSCEAAMAGTNVASPGACPAPPAAGCSTNSQCGPQEYCSKTRGDCAGTGTCKLRPQSCVMLADPVLGCNGVTYSNTCVAAQNGVNLQ